MLSDGQDAVAAREALSEIVAGRVIECRVPDGNARRSRYEFNLKNVLSSITPTNSVVRLGEPCAYQVR